MRAEGGERERATTHEQPGVHIDQMPMLMCGAMPKECVQNTARSTKIRVSRIYRLVHATLAFGSSVDWKTRCVSIKDIA